MSATVDPNITYSGEKSAARFHGIGTYMSPKGVYMGSFQNGEFHGEGTLRVTGGRFVGTWEKGRLVKGNFVFEDGLAYVRDETKWNYCQEGDRRFYSEVLDGVLIEGPFKYATSSPHPPALPEGCYDVIEGYYDPETLSIRDYETHEEIRRPRDVERFWIVDNCRRHPPASASASK